MRNKIIQGDIREIAKTLPGQSVNCIVTSPPYYGLRDYGHDGQIGKEETIAEYVNTLVGVFRELRRVLRDDGALWLNLGDSYSSGSSGQGGDKPSSTMDGPNKGAIQNGRRSPSGELPPKNLLLIPQRVIIALQDDGWIARSDIIWSKPNPMPESVTDRPTNAHEYIFLLSKKAKYYYEADAIREPASAGYKGSRFTNGKTAGAKKSLSPIGQKARIERDGRNKRSVWEVSTRPYHGAHFAVFPPKLITPCVLAGCPPGGLVLDPFFGSGTVAQVAIENGRNWLGVEINPEYIELARRRIAESQPALMAIGNQPELAI